MFYYNELGFHNWDVKPERENSNVKRRMKGLFLVEAR
jgi:hypothetical protein